MQLAVVVDNRAIQIIEGQPVIFVKNAAGFERRLVSIGQTDHKFSQVLSGLQPGEQYAVENSYLLKADLGKSSASHAH
jgi:cobalt-zinc-cadmium efflux system membrane fusion protein